MWPGLIPWAILAATNAAYVFTIRQVIKLYWASTGLLQALLEASERRGQAERTLNDQLLQQRAAWSRDYGAPRGDADR